ncbi:MAG: CheB methylesterase domain-containing protein [Aureliella sp.]
MAGGSNQSRRDAIAIGASTGGPTALRLVLRTLCPQLRGTESIFITQHMDPRLLEPMRTSLQEVSSQFEVFLAEDRMPISKRAIFIAPADRHLTVQASTRTSPPSIRLSAAPPVQSCRPAVDPMFQSLASFYRQQLIAVVLTGMGCDGLDGARDVKKHGGTLIVQDEATSTVWGMPKVCFEAGLADEVLPISHIARTIASMANPLLQHQSN